MATKKATAATTKKKPPPMRRKPSTGEVIIKASARVGDLMDDPESIKDWDDEELEHGYRRDKNGRFTGRPPRVVPHVCYQELQRRFREKAHRELAKNAKTAVDALLEIVKSNMADDKARVAAAKIILDRSLGKEPQTLDIEVKTPPWLKALQGGIVALGPGKDGSDEDDIIDIDDDDIEEVG